MVVEEGLPPENSEKFPHAKILELKLNFADLLHMSLCHIIEAKNFDAKQGNVHQTPFGV